MKKLIFTLVILVLLPAGVNAEYSLSEYQKIQNSNDTDSQIIVSLYLAGVGRGICWATTAMESKSGYRLYCPPANLLLDESVIKSLLDQEIRQPSNSKPYSKETPIELILTRSLIYRFPCE